MNMKKQQRGVAVMEFAFVLIIILVSLLLVAGIVNLQEKNKEAQSEITAAKYKELKSLAEQSCSGARKLKLVASTKPISYADYGQLHSDLEGLAKAQAAATARATIANLVVECV